VLSGHQHHLPYVAPAPKLIDPAKLAAFVDPLPIPQSAKPQGTRPNPAKRSEQLPYYRIPIQEFTCKVHRDVAPTKFWGYGGSVPGPVIEARSGEGILVAFPNELPTTHFLPIDNNIMGAEVNKPPVRTVVHLHGGKAPAASDGYPENWYVPGKSAVNYYPNQQEPSALWYHDHAMGITRLNTYAGMAGLYTLRDSFEDALNLPKGEFEIPLVLMDRTFRADGQLYYPVSQRAEAPWVPEFFGNAVLVNGKLLPFLEVQPRKYRFRILNAANARFHFLTLSNGEAFHQIGSDQGLLGAPVEVKRLAMAPAERADVVLDFAGHAGEEIVLNDMATPLMQFRVAHGPAEDLSSLPAVLRPVPKMMESSAVRTRRLTLEEFDNLLAEPITHLLDGKRWHEPISEKPVVGTTEIWELMNLTDDTHPIHLHLVRFQVLDRRPIDVDTYIYQKKLRYVGEAVLVEPNEAGWKDTVRVTPATITRIIVKFDGYVGRYVWHCHILEHEDNEMMRPFEVVAHA
jgi:spore coat protein A, manganese oxidase